MAMPISYYTVIVAGGSGNRMGTTTPKQFLPLLGLPVLMHTLTVFHGLPSKPSIVVVLPENEIETWRVLCQKHSFSIPHSIVAGGSTRFHSVQNGLNSIEGSDGLVAIHDGVRPLVSPQVVELCYSHALKHGNAVPAITPVETVRLGIPDNNQHYNRSNVWLGQTPQVFHLKQIKEYFRCSWDEAFTDEASVAESAGATIHIVEGNKENIKITTPADLVMAEAIIKGMAL